LLASLGEEIPESYKESIEKLGKLGLIDNEKE